MAITLDQVCAAVENGIGASFNITFATAPAVGSLVVVGIGQWDATADIGVASVTDNQVGNTYKPAVTKSWTYTAGYNILATIYYATNVASSGTFTITINRSTSGCDSAAGASSYLGIEMSSPLTNSNQGTGTSPNSGSVTPSRNAVYVGAMCHATTGTSAPAAPWDQRYEIQNCSYAPVHGEDDIISGVQTAAWTIGTSGSWVGVIAAFLEAGMLSMIHTPFIKKRLAQPIYQF